VSLAFGALFFVVAARAFIVIHMARDRRHHSRLGACIDPISPAPAGMTRCWPMSNATGSTVPRASKSPGSKSPGSARCHCPHCDRQL
jgi:hypothetical protein